jgi:hypothetical protein
MAVRSRQAYGTRHPRNPRPHGTDISAAADVVPPRSQQEPLAGGFCRRLALPAC